MTDAEIRAAALQYVRKISGFRAPSAANAAVFDAAVEAIAASSADLLRSLTTNAPPKDRVVEREKAIRRAERRDRTVRKAAVAAPSG